MGSRAMSWMVALGGLALAGLGCDDGGAGTLESLTAQRRAEVVKVPGGAGDTWTPPSDTSQPPQDTWIANDSSAPGDTWTPPADTTQPPSDSSQPPADTALPPNDTGPPCSANPELCNGADDNCNGSTDEGFAGLGGGCDGASDPDLCSDGVVRCLASGVGTYCDDDPSGPVETCNGVDDDCDGATDEADVCPPATPTVCYQGVSDTWDVCFDLVPRTSFNDSGYDYPASTDPRYQPPVNYLDLQGASGSTKLAKNFRLDEFMQTYKGRYGVYSPKAVQRWQAVRDGLGASLNVNSGYRNVSYNAGVDGATFSRHMYGDAGDVASGSASLQAISDACYAQSADFVLIYTSHVHCDWRDDPLGHGYWPSASTGPTVPGAADGATSGDNPWLVGVWGDVNVDEGPYLVGAAIELEATWGDAFDEGEPWVRWEAWGPGGLVEVVEPTSTWAFTAPASGRYAVSWSIGGALEGEVTLDVAGAP